MNNNDERDFAEEAFNHRLMQEEGRDDIPFELGDRVEQIHGGGGLPGREVSPFGRVAGFTERGFVVQFDEPMWEGESGRCEFIAKDAKYLRSIPEPEAE